MQPLPKGDANLAHLQSSLKMVEEVIRLKQAVYISGDALPITFQTQVISMQADKLVLVNHIRPRFISAFMKSRAFGLQVGMVRFQADRILSDGEHMIFPLRKDSVIEETRQSERFYFNADERVIVEILNPFDNETKISKSVMDMSATGLSLRTTFDSMLFQPDTSLSNLRVLVDGELYKKGAGRVVYRRKLMDVSGHLRHQVGIKFES